MTGIAANRGRLHGVFFRHCTLVLLLLWVGIASAADLFDAVGHGDIALVQRLLAKSSANVNVVNDDGLTPLLLAVQEHRVAIVPLLLSAGASVRVSSNDGLTPLHIAVQRSYDDLIPLLLTRKADLNARDGQGWTPLQWALATGQIEIATLLLSKGAAVNAADNTGITPLHWAATDGLTEVMELLLARGASLNTTDQQGYTPLHWAAATGQASAVKLLLAHGANVNMRDKQGRTPLMLADEEGQTAVLSLLLPVQQATSPTPTDTPSTLHFVAPDEPPASLPTGLSSHRMTYTVQVTQVEQPLSVRATALATDGDRLYIGLANGSVTAYDPDSGKGFSIPPPVDARRVRAITASDDTIWWLLDRPSMLCAYRQGTVTAYAADAIRPDSPLALGAPSTSLTCWRNRLAICTRDGIRALDPETGNIQALSALLPAEIAGAIRGVRTFLLARNNITLLAAVRQSGNAWTATCWQSGGMAWHATGAQSVAAWCGLGALSTDGLALIGSTQMTALSLTQDQPAVLDFRPDNARRMPSPCWAVAGGAAVWWGGGDVLYQAVPTRGEVYAYLPWNDPGIKVDCAAADDDGVWLATTHGVRWLAPASPSSTLGYAGFVRLRLGADAEQPITDADRMLATAVEKWQGTPYVYGGASLDGTDCSGFVMGAHLECGISLPHGSDNLRSTAIGQVVRDELRYGDVLVYPGHAALYLGNGRTAETVTGKGVSKSTIWARRTVVVRRFLNIVPARPNIQLASRAGDRNLAAKRKAAVDAAKKNTKKR